MTKKFITILGLMKIMNYYRDLEAVIKWFICRDPNKGYFGGYELLPIRPVPGEKIIGTHVYTEATHAHMEMSMRMSESVMELIYNLDISTYTTC